MAQEKWVEHRGPIAHQSVRECTGAQGSHGLQRARELQLLRSEKGM